MNKLVRQALGEDDPPELPPGGEPRYDAPAPQTLDYRELLQALDQFDRNVRELYAYFEQISNSVEDMPQTELSDLLYDFTEGLGQLGYLASDIARAAENEARTQDETRASQDQARAQNPDLPGV